MLLPKGKDFKLLFERPPYGEWISAAVVAALELYVLFVACSFPDVVDSNGWQGCIHLFDGVGAAEEVQDCA